MFFFYYKRRYPDDVLVYVEEFDKGLGLVLFDFLDSNEYFLFNNTANRPSDLSKPSMVLLSNYKGRTIRENTFYSIKPAVIRTWSQLGRLNVESLNSFLLGDSIDCGDIEGEIFSSSVSLNDDLDWHLNYYMRGRGDVSKIPIQRRGKLDVTIRNVGQGNWNEVSYNDAIKVVFDAGAPMNASKAEVRRHIGNRNTLYAATKPVLILSHWDKDHYHSLVAMSDDELKNNFSGFVCRDRVPNLTSRVLFSRISQAVGIENTFCVSADDRFARGGPTHFRNLNSIGDRLVLYNAQHHKNRNISGLALSVKTGNNSVILSGDAHYDQISRDILQHLNYPHRHCLVVPHHGGRAGRYEYVVPSRVALDRAIISVGPNRYGHPFASNVESLHATGFEVRQTLSGEVTVNL